MKFNMKPLTYPPCGGLSMAALDLLRPRVFPKSVIWKHAAALAASFFQRKLRVMGGDGLPFVIFFLIFKSDFPDVKWHPD